MKYFKKFVCIFIILVLIVVTFFLPYDKAIEAQTLRSLKEELTEKKNDLANKEEEKKLTEKQITEKKNNISAINKEIVNISNETVKLTEEIEKLNVEIEEKEQEIKEIINYYQLSNGESAYLEYLFKAKNFTDFIYRFAISEQLSNYNDKLINEYNAKIEENENKKNELAKKKISLNNKQVELENELETLGSQLGEVTEESVSIEDEIEALEKLIDTYENMYGCSLDEDVRTCGLGKLPADTAFYRPVESGMVSANYGIYYPWGYAQMHYGLDIAGTGHGANVYSMAAGRVAYIVYKSSCGGNMLYIHHVVNGEAYTTGYFHLATVNVQVGDTVTTNTVIGTVGGNSSIETWDRCSTGTHLHIQIAYTNIPQALGFYTKFTAKSFNPRNVLNLPSEGSYFYDRISKY